MPYSNTTFDGYVLKLLDLLQPATVLDIGAGAGKYGKMVRDWGKSKLLERPWVTGVEADDSYISRFELAKLYDTLIVDDANTLIHRPKMRFDLVILGDVIEHMRKSRALDLLNFLVYRSGYIVVVTPDKFQQDDWEGHALEAHISTWSEHDFVGWDTLHREYEGMHLFLIKGYQPSRMTITG